MFRSTLSTLAAGSGAGVFVGTVTADKFEAALTGFLFAALVAGSDYLSRRNQRRAHEENVTTEHEKTRAHFDNTLRRMTRRRTKNTQRKKTS